MMGSCGTSFSGSSRSGECVRTGHTEPALQSQKCHHGTPRHHVAVTALFAIALLEFGWGYPSGEHSGGIFACMRADREKCIQ